MKVMHQEVAMKEGTVKWFDNVKGYGFIREEGDEADIFVHYSVIEGDGFKTLKAGERVNFEIENGPKGLLAKSVARDEAVAGAEILS
jgi:CspA family cold shock protein